MSPISPEPCLILITDSGEKDDEDVDEEKLQNLGARLSGLGGVEEEEVHGGGEVDLSLVSDGGEGGGTSQNSKLAKSMDRQEYRHCFL